MYVYMNPGYMTACVCMQASTAMMEVERSIDVLKMKRKRN